MAASLASFISDFWNDQLVEHERQWLFLVLPGLNVVKGRHLVLPGFAVCLHRVR